jgi:hypothetical protein
LTLSRQWVVGIEDGLPLGSVLGVVLGCLVRDLLVRDVVWFVAGRDGADWRCGHTFTRTHPTPAHVATWAAGVVAGQVRVQERLRELLDQAPATPGAVT